MSNKISVQQQLLTIATLALCAAPACSGNDDATTDGSTGGAASTGGDAGETSPSTTVTPTTDPTTGPAETGVAETGTDATGIVGETSGTGDDTTGDGTTGHVSRGDTETASTGEPAPSCEDAVQNQDESDVDCGGANCEPCADGAVCVQDTDCQIGTCILGVCAAPSCEDGIMNADETDADCGGGVCGPCMDNLACVAPEDCISGVCTENLCTPASCADAVKNGDETDVDCGGLTCDGCLGDLACNSNEDCLSEVCTDGLCEQVGCLADVDCDALDTECTSGMCKKPGFTCVAVPINDGEDCTGADKCFLGTTCGEGVCGGGTPVDCAAMSDQCNVGTCDPGTGTCGKVGKPDGTKCEDGVACTKLEVCKAGACGGSTAPVLVEAFANNAAGWTLDTEWAIGPTALSAGCYNAQDPAADHTPTDDNGVAAVGLGACIASQSAHDYYCLTSPVADLSKAPADIYLSYWRWLNSDYTPYMKNKLEVYNGNTWVILFETFGSPGTYDGAWKFFSYDVSAHKNDKFQARWCFNVGNGVFKVAGWNVDDVTLGANACMQ